MKTIPDVLQLKISLEEIRPLIWRRVLISSDATFFDLHVAIQDAFGWEDSHLHQFLTGNPYGRKRDYQRIAWPSEELDFSDNEEVIDERVIRLGDWLTTPKSTLWYEYDFGDDWTHKIVLEK